jgi:hypothetical protein
MPADFCDEVTVPGRDNSPHLEDLAELPPLVSEWSEIEALTGFEGGAL